MHDGWTEIDGAILELLVVNGPMAPSELARHLGISDGEATAFLCMLAREGKVRIGLVESAAAARTRSPPSASKPPKKVRRHRTAA